MNIGIAQINPIVGDFTGNANRILNAYRACVDSGAELVITPEMALVGYPARDLLVKIRFVEQCLQALDYIASETADVPLLVGYVDIFNFDRPGKPLRNAAALLRNGKVETKIWKTLLPSYDMFDEQRYFEPGESCEPVDVDGVRLGITIGQDIWADDILERPLHDRDPIQELKDKGAELIINISASPFYVGKPQVKANLLEVVSCGTGLPVVYCNAVGANDQFVFDGHSMFLDNKGNEIADLPGFKQVVKVVNAFEFGEGAPRIRGKSIEHVHDALVMGLHDYVRKTGYESVCLGLSGGIDSALTAALAVKALGSQNVLGLNMPSPYSSKESVSDALKLASNLKIECEVLPINSTFESLKDAMRPVFGDLPEDVTEENMQARIRGMMLMALANKRNYLLLSTGNKSELSIGYNTIYGDMSGGLGILSDLPKTLVYDLARYINSEHEWIPQEIIDKEPSPELKPDQKDSDVLPPYEELDEILEYYMNYHLSVDDIVEGFGFSEETVRWVQRRVDLNEWKRQQAAPGIWVTTRPFGSGRRIPIVQRFVD